MKKYLQLSLFLLLIFISSQVIFSQEINRKGVHQLQKEEFGNIEKVESKFDIHGKGIQSLQERESSNLSNIVFGFLPYWEYSAGAHNNMHYDLLTHLVAFDFTASSSGAITNPSNWPWTDVINAAHSNNVKVIMAVTNFNGTDIHTILTNTTSKNNLFSNIENTITTYNLDGVNIDFESLNNADEGSAINTFMSDLTTFIHNQLPGKEVSFDGPAVNWGNDWDLNGLAQSVDYLFIMAYDYNGSWSTNTGAVAPLTHPSGGISVTKSLTNDYSVAKSNYPEKLILGVPYYGKHWKTTTNLAGSSITSYISSTFYRDDVLNAVSYGGYIWDNNSQTSWYRWFDTIDWNQVWSDNEQSIEKKYDLALAESIGGVGIWALNYDGTRPELWDLINTKFGVTASVEDSFVNNNIRLYPNPTSGIINISNSKKLTKVEVTMKYLLGQIVLKVQPENKSIDISKLTNGLYFLIIEDKIGNIATFKVLKSD